jgi:sulfur-carrier protein
MIKVLFFAKLSEQLGQRELFVDANLAKDTGQLFQYLTNQKVEWQTILTSQPCLKAVNQSMVNGDVSLKDGDEVAYFPPVTGG